MYNMCNSRRGGVRCETHSSGWVIPDGTAQLETDMRGKARMPTCFVFWKLTPVCIAVAHCSWLGGQDSFLNTVHVRFDDVRRCAFLAFDCPRQPLARSCHTASTPFTLLVTRVS